MRGLLKDICWAFCVVLVGTVILAMIGSFMIGAALIAKELGASENVELIVFLISAVFTMTAIFTWIKRSEQ
jgi:membrane protein implicated in regulation of membrane protease activity